MTIIHKIAMLLACSATIPGIAANIEPVIQSNVPSGSPVRTTMMRRGRLTPQRAEAETAQLTVSVMLDKSRGQVVQNVLVISADAAKPVMYEAAPSGNVFKADVAPGVYDIVVYIKSDNEYTQIFLFQENEDISGTKRILLNQRNATISSKIGRTSPSGLELSLPDLEDPGNCTIADHLMMLRHSDFGTLLQDETATFRNVCTSVSTNLIPERFSLTRMDAYTWEGGATFMVIPVDFNNDYNGPAGEGWQNVGARFAETPMSTAWKALQTPPLFAMTGYFVVADGHCNAYVGVGNYNHEFLTDRIFYWVPEGYGGTYEYYPVLRDNLIEMADASVSSMPYKMTAEGLVPSGLNLAGSGSLMLTEGMMPDSGHPQFSDPLPEDAVLANAVPALVCLPSSADSGKWDNGFMYDFTGRYGEQLGLNAYNFSDILTDSELESIGGYHRTISVKCDGTEICSSPGKFFKWLDWGNGRNYAMEMEMTNVLIDGELPGVNKASLTYDASDGYIPTLTALQIRDRGIVTDRLDKCDNATLELTAASFAYSGPRNFIFEAPETVTAEYAPHGDSDFSELSLTEVPENFYLPGYGTYYTASLENVDRDSDDKWYDLRITVKGESGALQTQTLSPAFRLEHPAEDSSVETVSGADSTCKYDVYSTDGRIIAHRVSNISSLNLDKGVYIIAGNNSTRKLIIR